MNLLTQFKAKIGGAMFLPQLLVGELRARLIWAFYSRLGPHLSTLHRKRLNNVTFIGITGSAGKTTAKLLTTAIVATAGQVREWKGSGNVLHHIQHIIRSTKPSDDFCVVELSAGEGPGFIEQQIAVVKPQIGVITTIGTEHFKAYHSIEAIAAEKRKLIESLPPEGTAILNADDPLVLAMGDSFPGKIITYGVADGASLRAENVRSAWPDRLSFTATHDGVSVDVQTQLCGSHWTSTVLAALASGLAAGIPLEVAARAVTKVEPFMARMEPVETPGDVTFIRDDWKAPLWAMPTAFDFVAEARAQRKIVIIGTISDYGGPSNPAYRRTAEKALEVADFVFFVGPLSSLALSAKRNEDDRPLRAFSTVESASDYLNGFLRPGDLVLIKGSGVADHLGRLANQRLAPISCWRTSCGKEMLCESCPSLRSELGRKQPVREKRTSAEVNSGPVPTLPHLPPPFKVIVGIGNPGGQYQYTPHNIGFHVVDIIANRFGWKWKEYGDVALTHGSVDGGTLLLVKPLNYVNNTGPTLLHVSEDMGFTPQDCLLVHDDIALPFGKLRTRMTGSDGGHKGVLSVLLSYQTDKFPRVKIGVNHEDCQNRAEYLTAPLPASMLPSFEKACEDAVERVLALIRAA